MIELGLSIVMTTPLCICYSIFTCTQQESDEMAEVTEILLGVLIILVIILIYFEIQGRKHETDINSKLEKSADKSIGLSSTIEEKAKNFYDVMDKIKGTVDGHSDDIENSMKNLNNFQDRLSSVQNRTFGETKGKGLLGEALVRNSFEIIFGTDTQGSIWFDPKNKDSIIDGIREDLKEIRINPDFLLKLDREHWIVIDAKTYLLGAEAFERLVEFEKGDKDSGSKSQVRKDIDAWINQIKGSANELIKKGYLEENNLQFLWIVAPDKLVNYYLQKNENMFIIDKRAMLVSFTGFNWALMELKARNLTGVTSVLAIENTEWVGDLKNAAISARDLQSTFQDWTKSITESLNQLTEIKDQLDSGDMDDKVRDFVILVESIAKNIEDLHMTDYNPKIKRNYTYEPDK